MKTKTTNKGKDKTMLKDFEITNEELSELETSRLSLTDQAKLVHGTPAQFSLVQERLSQYNQGLITFDEMQEGLGEHKIHGAIDGDLDHICYIGYDYRNQEWIEVDLNR